MKMLSAYVVAAVVLASFSAQAAEKTMPINFVGDWCFFSQDNKTTSYQLPSWIEDGHCTKILSINQYGFYGEGINCEPVSVRLGKDTAPSGTTYIAMITARCRPDGPATSGTLRNVEINRYKGNLSVTLK